MKSLALIRKDLLLPRLDEWMSYHCVGDHHTPRSRRRSMEYLRAWLVDHVGPECKLTDLNPTTATAILDDMEREGKAATTIRNRRAHYHFFGKHLSDIYPGLPNPWNYVKGPKKAESTPQWFTEEEEFRLRQVRVGKNAFERVRNLLILECGLSLGLRREEICRLTVEQVTKDLRYFKSVRGKGRSNKNVPIPRGVREILEVYLPLRELELIDYGWDGVSPAPLFFSGTYTRELRALNGDWMFRLAKKLQRAAAVEDCHPHRWRHTAIRRCWEATLDMVVTKAFARHATIEQTAHYCMSEQSEVEEAVEKMDQLRLLKQEKSS